MDSVRIGLIGTGFMGKCHALAYGAVKAVFGDVPAPRLELLCEMPADKAKTMANQFGFARSTDDWRELINDPAVDIVCVTTPNKLHAEIAIAALEAGKHVHCEKPMALTLAEAEAMARAAVIAKGKTIVGYNYIRNPAFQHARKLIEEGAIGRVIHFRGFVDEDYQADPDLPWTWRATKAEAGLGALGDLGCHMISMAVELMGPIRSVIGDIRTVHATRPSADDGTHKPVENEDIASAILEFESGVQGLFSTSRSAWGRKNYMAVEVHGTQGMICFDQERMNELRLYQNAGDKSVQGYRTIMTGPVHEPYGNFVPAPGHQIGFNDLKTIEAASFLRAIAGGSEAYPSFQQALEFERVIHAIANSNGQCIVL
ncbi:Gfo/Idh/MocA family protein [Aminobacter sp. J44]|uniref:Gfo/Idh/MocA family protein n=1 Tax=Aminobacter sp. J44 TaxID=935262 RepID=UPI00119941C3|nr:Gfo/Idh/MocA family oxidoreductase [Aminobacter sp. J44]TWG65860.1 putative dehydrogenase [Aminobacter sp. J44]